MFVKLVIPYFVNFEAVGSKILMDEKLDYLKQEFQNQLSLLGKHHLET